MSVFDFLKKKKEPVAPRFSFVPPYATPTYYVRHPNNTYSVAVPQPGSCAVHDAENESQIAQLKFLLNAAPMMDAPEHLRAAASMTKFAYINPRTFASKYLANPSLSVVKGYGCLSGSPTKWVLLSTMPEGRVIFSPSPIPGIEKILNS